MVAFNLICKEKQYDRVYYMALFGVFIIGLGIKDMFSKNPVILRRYLVYTKDMSKDEDVFCIPVYMVPFL